MLKFAVSFLIFLACFVPYTQCQTARLSPAKPADALKQAWEREGVNYNGPAFIQEQLQHAQIARAVAERQAQLKRDTEKLVALTAELKEHVDKAGSNILSMEVIKKAAEIQKLARSVEEKMKNAY